MWCDLGESVRCCTCDIFSFLFDWHAHLERYILLKTPLESVQWFQGYEQLKGFQNNRNSFLFLAISHNQCCRLPTDPARSQHILSSVCLTYHSSFVCNFLYLWHMGFILTLHTPRYSLFIMYSLCHKRLHIASLTK